MKPKQKKLTCSVCGEDFVPTAAKNYEYTKIRKTCSESCQWIASEESKKRAREASLAKLAEKRSKKKKHAKEGLVNIYKLVHEKARRFAGCELEERAEGDDE